MSEKYGAKVTAHRLGLVITQTAQLPGGELTPEAFKELFAGGTPENRYKRLEKQVSALGLPQFVNELDYIKQKLEPQRFCLTGRDDPAEHAMVALERAMMIADTERYFQTLQRYAVTKRVRAYALQKNREQASTFPPGSAEERILVAEFRKFADGQMPLKNIPASVCASLMDRGYDVGIMSVRRTLQRLELIPKPKPQKKK